MGIGYTSRTKLSDGEEIRVRQRGGTGGSEGQTSCVHYSRIALDFALLGPLSTTLRHQRDMFTNGANRRKAGEIKEGLGLLDVDFSFFLLHFRLVAVQGN
jgi:hypothetical protein